MAASSVDTVPSQRRLVVLDQVQDAYESGTAKVPSVFVHQILPRPGWVEGDFLDPITDGHPVRPGCASRKSCSVNRTTQPQPAAGSADSLALAPA